MEKFYQPSGRVSVWFFMYLMVCAIGIVPLLALEYTYLASLISLKKINIIFFLINVFFMEGCCSKLVIQKGKVRNRKAAVFSALLLTAAFIFVTKSARPQACGSYGIMAVQFCALFLVMSAGFLSISSKPFCESSDTWAKKVSVLFGMPEDTDAFLRKLLMNKPSFWEELQIIPSTFEPESGKWLQVVTGSHLEFTLWLTKGTSDAYLTVVKKTAKPGRGGKVRYSEEELIHCLAVNRDIGNTLLTYRGSLEKQPVSVNVKEKQGLSFKKLMALLQGGSSIILLVTMVLQLKSRFGGKITTDVFFVYGITVFLISLLSLIGSFIKEAVIEPDQSDWEKPSEGRILNIKMADSGLVTKLYYGMLLIGSIGYLFAALKIYVL